MPSPVHNPLPSPPHSRQRSLLLVLCLRHNHQASRLHSPQRTLQSVPRRLLSQVASRPHNRLRTRRLALSPLVSRRASPLHNPVKTLRLAPCPLASHLVSPAASRQCSLRYHLNPVHSPHISHLFPADPHLTLASLQVRRLSLLFSPPANPPTSHQIPHPNPCFPLQVTALILSHHIFTIPNLISFCSLLSFDQSSPSEAECNFRALNVQPPGYEEIGCSDTQLDKDNPINQCCETSSNVYGCTTCGSCAGANTAGNPYTPG